MHCYGWKNENYKQLLDSIDELVYSSEIIIDRPKGSAHPKYPDFIYKVDYGYLKNTSSMDGAGIDVWVGTANEKFVDAIVVVVDLIKRDSEIKILLSCTAEEKNIIYQTSNETPNMKGILINRWAIGLNLHCIANHVRNFQVVQKLDTVKILNFKG